jgi:hypothetical protein
MPKRTPNQKTPRGPATKREVDRGTRAVTAVLSMDEFDQLDEIRAREHRTLSAQVRHIIAEYFAARRDAQTEAAR